VPDAELSAYPLALSDLPLSSRHTLVLQATILSDHGKPVIMTVDAPKSYTQILNSPSPMPEATVPCPGRSKPSILSLTGLGRFENYQQQPDRFQGSSSSSTGTASRRLKLSASASCTRRSSFQWSWSSLSGVRTVCSPASRKARNLLLRFGECQLDGLVIVCPERHH
jgi:hypothetical protein